MVESINIVELAFEVAAAVEKFLIKAKLFYYMVMLFGYRCPKCKGSLTMVAEGICRCRSCKYEFDPTIEFQRCLNCGGTALLRARRYQCKKCSSDITSKFLFDGLVFNRDYFREKMAESRQRKKQLKQRVQKMLAESRSEIADMEAANLNTIPGLVDALNGLTCGIDTKLLSQSKNQFDLGKYQQHILKHIDEIPTNIRDIPDLIENKRKDLIYRFVAAIFLSHEGRVDIEQECEKLWVKTHVDRQGQNIYGEIEGTDRIQRSLGTAASW